MMVDRMHVLSPRKGSRFHYLGVPSIHHPTQTSSIYRQLSKSTAHSYYAPFSNRKQQQIYLKYFSIVKAGRYKGMIAAIYASVEEVYMPNPKRLSTNVLKRQ